MDSTRIDVIAKTCHEANRVWCEANGDKSQKSWEDAPDWQRHSAKLGVVMHLNNPGAGDSASHDSWMEQKIADGWVFGEKKDPDATPPTHPCLVPFKDLLKFQQAKDRLFRYIVHAMCEFE